MSLYDAFGVPRDADPGVIKSAYRRRAKQTHPDVHPEKQGEFEKVNNAYLILSDPELRRKYDATGDETLGSPDNSSGQVFEIIAQTLDVVVQKIEQRGGNPLENDIVKFMQAALSDKIKELKGQNQTDREEYQKRIVRYLPTRFKVSRQIFFLERMVAPQD